MSSMSKGLLLAALHVALVLSLGGKLLYDRVTRPRVWVLCQVYDPDLPIRGRILANNYNFRPRVLRTKKRGSRIQPIGMRTDSGHIWKFAMDN
jgi:hypothetical protein